MIPFRRSRDGSVSARFQREEVDLLRAMASEAADLAGLARDTDATAPDPALRRLLPDAYPDDPEASAEFRRFTADGLAERKAGSARVMAASLPDGAGSVEIRLDKPTATAWMRTITDVRLVLAARLGIERDDDRGDVHDEESAVQLMVYDWLAMVQESLVVALRPRR